MAKVAQLTSVHPAYEIRILQKQCRSLAAHGHEVVLIAQNDRDDEVGGVRIRAVPVAPSRLSRMTRTVWQVYRAALDEQADIYHFHDPELLPIGILLALGGRRAIYDAHEKLESDILDKDWVPRPLRWLVAKTARLAEAVAARVIAGVVGATPAIAAQFPPAKTALVQNYPLLVDDMLIPSDDYDRRENIVAFIGFIDRDRGIFELVDAMAELPAELDARLVLAGDFVPPELGDELASRPGWARTEMLGWCERKQVRELLARARVGLVTYHGTSNYLEAQPTKLYEYMAAGLPVVASDFPLWRQRIEETGCGVVADPTDPAAIAGAIESRLRDGAGSQAMGERGRNAVTERFNWDHESRSLFSLYDRLLGRGEAVG